MYETEVNHQTAPATTVPADILADLAGYRAHVRARSLMPWGEHCTECMWPSCYSSCGLYEPRSDGNCRQFVGGVVRVPTPAASVPYLQKITFRRWGKLWSPGSTACQPLDRADRWERINIALGTAARSAPAPAVVKRKLLGKYAYLRRDRLSRPRAADEQPDYFVAEIINLGRTIASLTLSVKAMGHDHPRIFQRLLTVRPGLHRERVAFSEIAAALDGAAVFDVEIVPNDAEDLTLMFGLLDFVQERPTVSAVQAAPPAVPAAKCKCVVWDLDNTLWHGTLIEDGREALRLRDGVVEVIQALDVRGVLQSIASKNSADDALGAVREFGLDGYFLYPQVNWGPKSSSLKAIASSLNIDASTFVFVDDQPFERDEVRSALPGVRVLDAAEIGTLLDRPEFDVPVTDESRRRRTMYQQQEQRNAVEASYAGDYLRFLRDNGMKVFVAPLTESDMKRVFELAQRTNQMNFSGNRYSLDELQRLAADPDRETFVIRCVDRFGDYGIVGFAVADTPQRRLLDLMFSCRVQSKRVEHAFLAWVIKSCRARAAGDFHANYRKTPKNAPSGAVFAELGFVETGVAEGVSDLRFGGDCDVPDDGIVTIVVE